MDQIQEQLFEAIKKSGDSVRRLGSYVQNDFKRMLADERITKDDLKQARIDAETDFNEAIAKLKELKNRTVRLFDEVIKE